MNTINILLIDDEEKWMPLLNDVISKEPRLKLHQIVKNATTALEKISTESIDLVLLDYHLGESDLWGVDLAKKILSLKSSMQIIFWSVHVFEKVLIEAKKAGAVGYINKSSGDANAINKLLIKVYESKDDKKLWIEHPSFTDKFEDRKFTRREIEILSKLAQAKTPDQIAVELKVRINLVSAHILNIKEKVFFRKYGRDRKRGTKDKNGKWIALPEPNVSMIEVIEFAIKEFPNENRTLPENIIMGKIVYRSIYRHQKTWEEVASLFSEEALKLREYLKIFLLEVKQYFSQNDSSIARTAIRFDLEIFEVEEILSINPDNLS